MRIFLAAAALLLFAEPVLAEGDLYAAIAYSQASKAVGIAKDKNSKEDAEQAASTSCGAASCKTISVRNGCAVLAVASDGAWAINGGDDQPDANQRAIAACTKYAKSSCRVRATATMPPASCRTRPRRST
ncbi:DUF4189 domain-containing protein [Bradyrhizobium jicamae]|uniref:DUF4189 domain-containing protein n=1 Tax=Bradyrhizobium jicamae TaxID=280332 RepID=UPI001BAC5718|nr:DUF4189 domain-containing protein [Bradyrhizobium jicamae]